MPPEHVLDKRLLMYIQIYNLKRCFECKCKKICVKKWIFYTLRFCCAEFSAIQESLWGKNHPYLTVRVPAITLTCPITTMLFVDLVKQFYGSKNAYDRMEYMLTGADIEPACSGALRSLRAILLKIARRRVALTSTYIFHNYFQWIDLQSTSNAA